ncbi:MAG TPA: coenzyme F420-0:L-glutamate ligase [Nitrososphaeraceae archaeon]|nr:coenzyme F420-0:L-glutamate ligase [Nitrososphaeraceae archaeon]
MEIFPLHSSIKRGKFDLFNSLIASGLEFKNDDIIVISSKYVSMSEGALLKLSKIKVSKKAQILAIKFNMNPKIAELTIRESDYILGGIPGFLLSITDGMIAPNAGIDKSNVPSGFVIPYPNNAFKTAEDLRLKFLIYRKIRVGIVIADSRLMPTRIGTVGVAIGCAGFEPVEDERGKKDLFGNVLRVTLRAVADGLAATGVMVMGEGSESIPAVVIRGFKVTLTDRKLSKNDMIVDPDQDIYIRGLGLGQKHKI